jgi:hypothetical protein
MLEMADENKCEKSRQQNKGHSWSLAFRLPDGRIAGWEARETPGAVAGIFCGYCDAEKPPDK